MSTQLLSLNPKSGCYEATITLKIEEEIVWRAFQRYVEEHHVDLTNPASMQEAITQVAQVSKWIDHPRTQKVCPVVSTAPLPAPVPVVPAPSHPSTPLPPLQEARGEEKQEKQEKKQPSSLPPASPTQHTTNRTRNPDEPRKKPHHVLSEKDKQALIDRAMALPVDRWYTEAVTPIPDDLPPGKNYERGLVHRIRHAERYELEQLKRQLEPVHEDVLAAVASAVNGTRIP